MYYDDKLIFNTFFFKTIEDDCRCYKTPFDIREFWEIYYEQPVIAPYQYSESRAENNFSRRYK